MQEAAAATGGPRQRVLRGRNERDWPDVEVPRVPRMRDPAAADPRDPYTIASASAGGAAAPTRSRTAQPLAPAIPPQAPTGSPAAPRSSGRTTPHSSAPDSGGTAAARKPTMSKEAIQRLAAKAPVLPTGAPPVLQPSTFGQLRMWDHVACMRW